MVGCQSKEQVRQYAEREADLNGLEAGEDRALFVEFMICMWELGESKRQKKEAERRADNG